jgi:hypothetical protein
MEEFKFKLTCEAIADKYFKNKEPRAVLFNNKCIIDYKDSKLQDELSSLVDCEELCSDKAYRMGLEPNAEFEEEVKACVVDCKDSIELSCKGSVSIDKDTLQVQECTIPIPCSIFYENGEWSWKKVDKITKKLAKLGCYEAKEGWMHAHEFVGGPEIEEEPAICYIHVTGKEKGKCKLPDVLKAIFGR